MIGKSLYITIISLLLVNSTMAITLDSAGLEEISTFNSQSEAIIKISPEYPAPNAKVHATLVLKTLNVVSADIAWVLDDTVIQSGKGLREIEITTNNIGELTKLSAVINPKLGSTLLVEVLINPSSLTIIKEAQTYTPPFYKGRSRLSTDSYIRIVALASVAKEDGVLYEPSELTYIWSRNSIVQSNVSGVGMSSVLIKAPGYLGKDLITLEVRGDTGSIYAQSGTFIESSQSKIVLYEKKPLIGITFFDALSNGKVLFGTTLNIVAEPYFMDIRKRNSNNLKYTWAVGGQTVSLQDPQSELAFTLDDSSLGNQLNIAVAINNVKNLIQAVSTKVLINFTNETGGFGL